LGALGRRFESCRPDSIKPIHRQPSQAVFFIAFLFSHEKGALGEALKSSKISF